MRCVKNPPEVMLERLRAFKVLGYEILKPSQVARILGASTSSVYNLIQAGKIPGEKRDNLWGWGTPVDELEAWIIAYLDGGKEEK